MTIHTLEPTVFVEDIAKFMGKKVLIVGDVMLDTYLEGNAQRISPEAPVPIVHIYAERHVLGGAANVARNIRSLGGKPTLLGLCGTDAGGQHLTKLLHDADITPHVFASSHRQTIVKTRIMAQGQQMLRVDKEDYATPTEQEYTQLYDALDSLLSEHEVLIISDYAKGLLTTRLCEYIQEKSKKMATRPIILLDPKPNNAACYNNISLMTPNKKEASQLANMHIVSKQDILQAGQRIMQRFSCEELLITLGSEGMAFFAKDGQVWNIPTASKAVFDVTGAGDTVIATLALAYAAHISPLHACFLANYAAGLVLEQVGVACVYPQKLVSAVKHIDPPSYYAWQ